MKVEMYGTDTLVTLKDGTKRPAVNLDNGATTPPFAAVCEEIHNQLKMYGSIGRGVGQKSQHSSKLYTRGREVVKRFVGLPDNDKKYEVIYVNCTTDGMNKLASALITGHRDRVLCTRMEHHANDLPWRERARTVYADVDGTGRLNPEAFREELEKFTDRGEQKDFCRIKYVAVTAASNVTGYVNDVHAIAGIAHEYGAKIIVDGAQIVAHREFSMLGEAADGSEDIDFLVFSAHKMYSPYGGGAIVGLADVLKDRLPVFYGGGMVSKVTDTYVDYGDLPDLYEAGSPNYPGVVGMVTAMEILQGVGFNKIAEHEQVLLRRTIDGLKAINGVRLYGDCVKIEDRTATVVFNLYNKFLKPIDTALVANALAQHAGISVRHAKFCAHTYVDRLLQMQFGDEDSSTDGELDGSCAANGMVRAGFGIYSTEADADALISAVKELLTDDKIYEYQTDMFAGGLSGLPNDRG